jgi:hypothetical protein
MTGFGKAVLLIVASLIVASLPGLLHGSLALAASPIPKQKIPVPQAAAPRLKGVPVPKQVHAKLKPLAAELSGLIPFDISPFPFDGVKPNEGLFLNVYESGRRGHATGRGGTYWEDATYNDRRVLVSIPKGFDIRKPAVMVVFFHGNGATLERDVKVRQKVPLQVAQSGLNAVLVAPQFAVDAQDSSAGAFWQPGTFRQFLDEAVVHLVELYGDERTRKSFAKMPVVLVAYSGGYLPAAWSLAVGEADARVRGVVLLDALYGEAPKFSDWIASKPGRSGFFVSSFTASSAPGNRETQGLLAAHQIATTNSLPAKLSKGTVVFVPALPDAVHGDFVTHAFADNPIKEVLLRLPEFAHAPGTVKSTYKPAPPNDQHLLEALKPDPAQTQ